MSFSFTPISSAADRRTTGAPLSSLQTKLVFGCGSFAALVGIAVCYAGLRETVASHAALGGGLGIWWALDWIYCRLAKNPARPLDVIDGENVLTYSRLVTLKLIASHPH